MSFTHINCFYCTFIVIMCVSHAHAILTYNYVKLPHTSQQKNEKKAINLPTSKTVNGSVTKADVTVSSC